MSVCQFGQGHPQWHAINFKIEIAAASTVEELRQASDRHSKFIADADRGEVQGLYLDRMLKVRGLES